MIIYICEEDHKDRIKKMAEDHEWDISMDQLQGAKLSDYISERLQIITNLNYLIIDRTQLADTEMELNETIETLKYMYDVQVILLERELVDDVGEKRNVCYHTNYTSLLLEDERVWKNLENLLTGKSIPEEFEKEGIWIGIMSANSGAGATALAVGLANYIYQYDRSVCYVEANESGDLAAMADYYDFSKVEDSHYTRNEMDYWHQSIDQTKKYVVIDLGRYGSNKLKIFEQCTIKIMITDSKPYRMSDALNVYRYIGDDQTKFCLNYGSVEMYRQIKEQYLTDVSQVYELESHMDLFDVRDPFYQEIMQDYLHIENPSKFAFVVQPDKWKEWIKRKRNHKEPDPDIPDNAEEAVNRIEPDKEEVLEEIPEDVPEEIPEEITEDVPEEVSEEIPEETVSTVVHIDDIQPDEVNLEDVSLEQSDHNRKNYVKTFAAILVVMGLGAIGVLAATHHRSLFSFTNQTRVTEASTAVDEELNINPDIKISVLEVDGADGYEVSYSTDQSFPEERTVVVEVETADKAVESLAADKTYYVRVRAFKFKEDGTKVYGEYTDVQKIRT